MKHWLQDWSARLIGYLHTAAAIVACAASVLATLPGPFASHACAPRDCQEPTQPFTHNQHPPPPISILHHQSGMLLALCGRHIQGIPAAPSHSPQLHSPPRSTTAY
jgi:hypothetical protein